MNTTRVIGEHHYYRIIPRELKGDATEMTARWYPVVSKALNGLGYDIIDAGHTSEFGVIETSEAISKKHLGQLEKAFDLETDNGSQLNFA